MRMKRLGAAAAAACALAWVSPADAALYTITYTGDVAYFGSSSRALTLDGLIIQSYPNLGLANAGTFKATLTVDTDGAPGVSPIAGMFEFVSTSASEQGPFASFSRIVGNTAGQHVEGSSRVATITGADEQNAFFSYFGKPLLETRKNAFNIYFPTSVSGYNISTPDIPMNDLLQTIYESEFFSVEYIKFLEEDRQTESVRRLRLNPLTYAVTLVPTPVPEPTTWALVMVGFGAAGAMVRRRERMVA